VALTAPRLLGRDDALALTRGPLRSVLRLLRVARFMRLSGR
jgi:hypothetical protein